MLLQNGALSYYIARLPLEIIFLDEASGWVYKRAVILLLTIVDTPLEQKIDRV